MAIYIPPWLDQPPDFSPKENRPDSPDHKGPRLGWILTIAALVVLVGFLVALIIGIATAGPLS